MKEDPALPGDDAALHALVDGRLDAAARAALQARLDADADAARRVAAWSQQREALRQLHAPLLDEAIPPSLLQAAQVLDRRSSRFGQWQRWGGMAAAVVLAFGVGWASHGEWRARSGAAAVAGSGEFGRQALVAHVVYAPEVRHPVEVEAAQQEHLVQWLSKRVGRPLKIPNLQAQGYELVGGRLLPGDQGARAQFMFQNPRGERLTLYVGALAAQAGASGETAFRYTADQGVSSFYWVDGGFGYALSGRLPRHGLLVLAEAVYRQL